MTEQLRSTWTMDQRSKLSGISSSRKYVPFKAGGTTGTVQYTVPSFYLRSLNLCVLGYWSSGTRLADSVEIAGEGIEMGELPEYMVMFCPVNALVLLRLKKSVRWRSFQSATCFAPAPQI